MSSLHLRYDRIFIPARLKGRRLLGGLGLILKL